MRNLRRLSLRKEILVRFTKFSYGKGFIFERTESKFCGYRQPNKKYDRVVLRCIRTFILRRCKTIVVTVTLLRHIYVSLCKLILSGEFQYIDRP